MLYYFVINARTDLLAAMGGDFIDKIKSLTVPHAIYYTQGVGDATRFVRIYCDLHKGEEVCFVACGGSGTLAEVASGVVGFTNKRIAFLAFGSANDFCKHYPDRDFTSIEALLEGSERQMDILKANNFYSINVANAGFDSMVQYVAGQNIAKGMDPVKAYRKSTLRCMLMHRINKIKVTADGKPINKRYIMLCIMGNASWYGDQYHCAPKAVVDDGLIDVVVFKICSIMTFLYILKHFLKGTHLDDPRSKKHITYLRAKHVELDCKDLIYLCLDGELIPSAHFDVDVLPKAITMILPREKKQ